MCMKLRNRRQKKLSTVEDIKTFEKEIAINKRKEEKHAQLEQFEFEMEHQQYQKHQQHNEDVHGDDIHGVNS